MVLDQGVSQAEGRPLHDGMGADIADHLATGLQVRRECQRLANRVARGHFDAQANVGRPAACRHRVLQRPGRATDRLPAAGELDLQVPLPRFRVGKIEDDKTGADDTRRQRAGDATGVDQSHRQLIAPRAATGIAHLATRPHQRQLRRTRTLADDQRNQLVAMLGDVVELVGQ
ncbi:hypothetical protein D3C79_765740 [compost metagenome]